VVYLKDGKTVEGTAEDLGDKVRITTVTHAVITLPKSIVLKIESTPDPLTTYSNMLSKVKANDAEGYYQLALWCDDHRLSEQYAAMLRKTLEINPDHAEAKKLLYTYNKYERPLPENEAASKQLLAQFGPSFKIYRTPHYLICHDCDEAFVLGRARLFEKVYKQFYRFFERKGFTLDVINDRLQAVLFNTQQEYARLIPGAPGAGFYTTPTNCVYFFNSMHDDAYEGLRKEAYSARPGATTDADRQRRAQQKRELAYMGKYKAEENISVTIHEATHQLTYNLRLLNPLVRNPVWVVEGIACYFAPPTGGEWEGPGHIDRNMMHWYRKGGYHLSPGQLLSSGGQAASLTLDGYFNAWALTYYLLRERPKDFPASPSCPNRNWLTSSPVSATTSPN
jgi:hypothetical protein